MTDDKRDNYIRSIPLQSLRYGIATLVESNRRRRRRRRRPNRGCFCSCRRCLVMVVVVVTVGGCCCCYLFGTLSKWFLCVLVCVCVCVRVWRAACPSDASTGVSSSEAMITLCLLVYSVGDRRDATHAAVHEVRFGLPFRSSSRTAGRGSSSVATFHMFSSSRFSRVRKLDVVCEAPRSEIFLEVFL